MPGRLKQLFSRRSQNRKAEVDASEASEDADFSRPPPEYDQEHAIEPPDITAGFSNLHLSNAAGNPSVDECIAHLKVLESFYRLRQRIGSYDGLYGIWNTIVTRNSPDASEAKTAELLAKLAEKRWAIYVSYAVDRYEKWSGLLVDKHRDVDVDKLESKDARARFGGVAGSGLLKTLQFGSDNIPPLDVLMVWHAYSLNPRSYLDDSLRLRRRLLWRTPLPWKTVAESIDSQTFEYQPGAEAERHFVSSTGLFWENTVESNCKRVECPNCRNLLVVPETTFGNAMSNYNSKDWDELSSTLDSASASGQGYCDKNFSHFCTDCATTVTHDRLCVEKFRRDLERLRSDNVPMSGTLLDIDGIPASIQDIKDTEWLQDFSAIHMILRGQVGTDILGLMDKWNREFEIPSQSMSDIRKILEEEFASSSGRHLLPSGKFAIRRMMNRYWENSSSFGLDLVGAVIRQGSFIEKMHNIDWLHSPALPNTMKRLLVKYTRFVSIMRDRESMAVPTLEVDLAWHTHQLSPPSYYRYTTKVTNTFIDHDDKVGELKLNDAFAWTSKQYEKLYKESYNDCTCWYCEALLESKSSVVSRLFRTSAAQTSAGIHAAGQARERDRDSVVNGSTHNAVQPEDSKSYSLLVESRARELEYVFQKACDRARKKGRREPKRDDFYYSDAYGSPVYILAL